LAASFNDFYPAAREFAARCFSTEKFHVMDVHEKPTRRSFLGKVASGAVGLTVSAGPAQTIFASDMPQPLEEEDLLPLNTSSEKKFVPVMITPFTADMKIDYEMLSRLIDFYLAAGVKGFFANCLSSEMYHLNDEERLALARFVVKRVNGAVPVVASGSFGDTVEARAEFTKKMYHTGVNAVILITSHFADKADNDAALIHNLERYFKLTDNIPLGTYECPAPYKRILTPEVFGFLLSTNRLVYHKDTELIPEKIKTKLAMARGNRLEFYDAHAPNTLTSLQGGARGMSAIAGNFYPEIFVWMCNYVNDPSRQADVKWMQSEITRLDTIVSQGYPLSSKYFLQKRGLPIQVLSRSAGEPLTPQQKQAMDDLTHTLAAWHERLGIKA
jgi:4-hydroxy-tetrahydrodipicolinate synthase